MLVRQSIYGVPNGIELMYMLQQVSHNQVKRKQGTHSYIELILKTFTGHQEPKELNYDCNKRFKACMETVKKHSRKS